MADASGANNNKVCFIDIAATGSAPAPLGNVAALTLGWVERASNGRVTLRLDGSFDDPNGGNQRFYRARSAQ